MRQWLVLALALATASVLAGGVFANDNGGPRARAAATSLKLKQVTVDKRPVVDSAHWTITETSAKWDTSGFTGDYSWGLPDSISAGGATGAIKVISTDKSGGRYNGVITAAGSIVEGGSVRAEALADKNGGQATVTSAVPVDLLPGSCGSSCNVTVTVQDGPIVTFRYEPEAAQPPPCGSVARAFVAADCKQAPFGSEVSVPAPGESSPVQVSPERTPANAGEVILRLRELLFEEEANEIVASIEALLEKDPTIGQAFTGCVLLGNIQQGAPFVRYDEGGLALLKACRDLLVKNTSRPPARATGAASGCQAVFVPAFKKGVRVTKRKRRRAVASVKDRLDLSCSSRAGRLSASIRARKGKTLRSVTGPRLRTFAGRRLDQGSPGDQRLGLRWRARAG